MIRIKLLILLLCLLGCGCNNAPQPKDMLQREIIMPNIALLDKLCLSDIESDSFYSMKPKIFVYYNLRGCMSCRLSDLRYWQLRINKIKNSDIKNQVEYIFILRGNRHNKHFMAALNETGFRHTIYLDSKGEFERINKLPQDHKIRLIGSPLYNTTFWNRYKTRIQEIQQAPITILTLLS